MVDCKRQDDNRSSHLEGMLLPALNFRIFIPFRQQILRKAASLKLFGVVGRELLLLLLCENPQEIASLPLFVGEQESYPHKPRA